MVAMTNEPGQQPAPRPNEGENPGWFPLQPQEGPKGGHWQGQPRPIFAGSCLVAAETRGLPTAEVDPPVAN